MNMWVGDARAMKVKSSTPVHAVQCAGEIGAPLQDLGTLGGVNSYAEAINNAGIIAGESQLKDGTRQAFVYINGKMYNLRDLIEPGAVATDVQLRVTDINDSGQILGNLIYPKLSQSSESYILTPK